MDAVGEVVAGDLGRGADLGLDAFERPGLCFFLGGVWSWSLRRSPRRRDRWLGWPLGRLGR